MLVHRAGVVFDGDTVRPGHEVLVADDGTIAAVRPVQPPPAAADVVDHGAGTTLLPGLVDGHQHVSWGCTPVAVDGIPGDPDARREQLLANARRALGGGVTTVQDLGDTAFAVVEARDATRGDRRLPRLLAGGPPITTPGGHCHFLSGSETVAGGVEAAVRERVERGVDVVKVMASGGNSTPGSLPWQVQFDGQTLRRLVATAHGLGVPVAAHAHSAQSLRDCLAARVDAIEHCTFMTADGVDDDPALLAELAASGIVLRITPGMAPGAPPPPPVFAARIPALVRVVGRLRELGARIVVATDAGIGPWKPHDGLAHAVHELATVTHDPVDALTRATSAAADALGLTGECGRLAAGADADLLVVRGDATQDTAALREVEAVFRRGELVPPRQPDR